MIKKLDIVIIVLLLTLSFIPSVILGIQNNKEVTNTYAEIKVDGKVIDKISLSDIKEDKDYPIITPYGENTLRINKYGIYIYEADCTDKVCVRAGKITKVGNSLVCLPHKLIIEIKGEYAEDDDIILSH